MAENSIPAGCPQQSCSTLDSSNIPDQDISECDWEGRTEQQQQPGVYILSAESHCSPTSNTSYPKSSPCVFNGFFKEPEAAKRSEVEGDTALAACWLFLLVFLPPCPGIPSNQENCLV